MVSMVWSSVSIRIKTYINSCTTFYYFYNPSCSFFPGWKTDDLGFCLLFIKYVNKGFMYRQILLIISCFSGIFLNCCRTCLLNWCLVYRKETAGSTFGLFQVSFYYMLLKRAGRISSSFVDRLIFKDDVDCQ